MVDIAKKRILVVDDNEANLFTLVKILEKLNLVMDKARSGEEALHFFNSRNYSLVFLDIQMPNMDGFEVLQKMREIPEKKYIPVVLVSAIFTEDQYKLKGIQTGAIDFIPKPLNPEIIRAKTRIFLELEDHKASLRTLIDELETKNNQLSKEIQKRKKIEKELLIAKSKAEKKSEIQNQILVNMSHEIRTPVNSILGFADLIANPNIPDQNKEKYVRYVSNSSQNLLFLIDEILDHSRMEAGEFKINKDNCDLADLLTELKESFDQIKIQQGKKHLEINLHLPDTSETVETDSQRLRQVLINLLSNAVKYTENGRIDLGYSHEGSEIRLFVKDTGLGISKADQKTLFNRFKRVESADSLKSQGTGLGLSIAKRIVDKLGGHIGVKSSPKKGSEFYFTIPAAKTRIVEKNNEPETSAEEEMPNWTKNKIVIAEDEEMNFLFLQEALNSTGIEIIWAKNGKDAIDLTNQHNPDLVLMDVKMPDINGFEAIQAIRKTRPGQVVIIQTALAAADKEIKNYQGVFDDLVTKPINRNVLIDKMKNYLT